MKANELFYMIGNIDDAFISEAYSPKRKSLKTFIIKVAALAACLAMVLSVILLYGMGDSDAGAYSIEGGVCIPPKTISVKNGTECDMIGFFIYNGRWYTEYDVFEAGSVKIGEKLGTVVYGLDEWSEKDEYIELSGSAMGDFYGVEGFNTEFMLCMLPEDGRIRIFINDNGLTLKKGSDLYEKKFALSESYRTVEYQTYSDWYYGADKMGRISEENAVIFENFVYGLNEGRFMLSKDAVENGLSSANEIYHLFINCESGIAVHLRLHDGGYVRFDGMLSICVKVDEAVFDSLISILN